MDRTVLLLLTTLQIFLIITDFSSVDAAALITDDHQRHQTLDMGILQVNRMRQRQRRQPSMPHCAFFPGGCSLVGKGAPDPKDKLILKVVTPTNPPLRDLNRQ
ncbi:uncharacterized protein PAE49_015116 isoform 2-T2 [Odontesthes bonariensis]